MWDVVPSKSHALVVRHCAWLGAGLKRFSSSGSSCGAHDEIMQIPSRFGEQTQSVSHSPARWPRNWHTLCTHLLLRGSPPHHTRWGGTRRARRHARWQAARHSRSSAGARAPTHTSSRLLSCNLTNRQQLDDRLLAGRVLALARHEQTRAAVHRTRDAPRVTDEGNAYSQPHA